MATNLEITWMTLLGVSLLFVGGFVLWVYGTHTTRDMTESSGKEREAARKLDSHFVQWFLLYGGATVFAGIGCLLTATMLIL